jgi:hypothetical protein
MSECQRGRVRVRLDGLMSESQVEIVSGIIFGQLIGQAGDLDRLNQYRDPKKAIREVATLGRLTFWLEYREILVPDRDGRRLMRRTAREIDEMNEAGESTGGDPLAEHDAMWAYVALFSDWPAAAEVRDTRWEREHSVESSDPGGRK